uniref:(northern house mosquito) hypothetical protein n=1 Tax=Culex pipiens TaxID=7175 RepID=A0A8D8BSW5_CULPI
MVAHRSAVGRTCCSRSTSRANPAAFRSWSRYCHDLVRHTAGSDLRMAIKSTRTSSGIAVIDKSRTHIRTSSVPPVLIVQIESILFVGRFFKYGGHRGVPSSYFLQHDDVQMVGEQLLWS